MNNLSIWVAPKSRIYNLQEPYEQFILEAYSKKGVHCFSDFNGAFAFVIWDDAEKKAMLVRDRYGIKPLYYCVKGGNLLYGDSIKTILAQGLSVKVDLEALTEYFTFQNVFSDRTMFEGVYLLTAGCYGEWDLKTLSLRRYWNYELVPDAKLNSGEMAEELRRLFEQAVVRQCNAGGQVGCYLSGGMDSSCIAKFARDTLRHLYTFTCGFDLSSVSGLELAYDEREYSEYLANHIKSEQYEVVLHAGEMESAMPDLVETLEELRVGQCYPDYYVSKLAGKFVDAVLSGAGGDELFGGYPWRYVNAGDVDSYYNYWQRLVPDSERAELFNSDIYSKVKGINTRRAFDAVFDGYTGDGNPVNRCLYFELKTFLPALCLVDGKIGAAHGLETRLPFLDNDLVEYALRIPTEVKVSNLEGKKILRQAMRGVIPDVLLNRKKQGFSSPDVSWYRGESMEFVRRTLYGKDTRIYEYLNPVYCHRRIDSHLNGKVNERLFIWSLLCFETWLRRFMPNG